MWGCPVVIGILASVPAIATAQITVHVLNAAAVPGETLRRATRIARDMFQEGQIKSDWRFCPSAAQCSVPDNELEFVVRILPRSMEGNNPRGSLGTTIPESRLGYVFFSRLEESRLASEIRIEVILGSVLAHEGGHLLGLDHSIQGVMREQFDVADMQRALVGALKFNDGQRETMRHAILMEKAEKPLQAFFERGPS